MIDFRKISKEVRIFLEKTSEYLRNIGISTITPEAVAQCLWNNDCERPQNTEPLFWRIDRKDFVMYIANNVIVPPRDYNEVTETDYNPDMLQGFESILSEYDSVTMKNLSEWLVEKWLPEHYPEYFQSPIYDTWESREESPHVNEVEPGPYCGYDEYRCRIDADESPLCIERNIGFNVVRNPSDDDASTGETIIEYCDNMLAMAINGKLHRAIGREKEMEDLLLYLAMNTKNCPALIGKPGTGKTAIAEELAFRLASGDIPVPLRKLKLYRLDYSRIRASGQEEAIMRKIIDEAAEDPNLVLFIDEMHLLINNHPQAPNLVAQMLKPPMARGEIKIIGATTYEEYSQNIECDQAFERRFNPITIHEPDTETTKIILRRSENRFNHGLKLSDEALYEAIKLTSKYIKNRYLPAKAIELIDQAATRIALKGDGTINVTPEDLRCELSNKTGLPLERVSQDETIFLNNLEENLHQIVVGQDLAVKAVSDAIRTRRAGFGNDDRPIGSFLFLGTTGTGKTLLSKAVSQVLFGDKKKMVRLDMSEYREEVSTTKLIGPPPGYVGYENGGALTNAVIQNPYTVVLIDELEKAHPAVHNLFLQVLDEGHLTDNHGRIVDFSNTVVIMTSNICQSEILASLPEENITENDIESCTAMVQQQIKNYLPLELVNRLDKIVMFEPISFNDALRISDLILKNKESELRNNQNICLRHEHGVVEVIAKLGYSRQYGARNLERSVENLILTPLTQIKLQNILDIHAPIIAYEDRKEIKFRN